MNNSANFLVNPIPGQQLPALYHQQIQYIPDYQCVQALCQSQAEIERLRRQLDRKVLKEEELRHILKMNGNVYYCNMSSNRLVQVTQFVFEKVEKVIYDPLYGRKAQILIKLSTQNEPGLINEEDFWSDKKWITFLEQISRTKIKVYGAVKQVALLLRSIANESMTQGFVPYLGGWNRKGDRYFYCTFSDFRTSVRRGEPERYEAVYTSLPPNAKAWTERFLARFTPIQDPALRSFFIIWMHLSFLQTILLKEGTRLCKIPVVQTENPVVQAYLCKVLTVSADGLLNLNGTTDDFTWSLISCRDQPSVILPPKFGKNAMKNECILDEVVSSGTITLKKGGACPLGTLPVLLSNGGNQALSCGIPIFAGVESFDLPQCAVVAAETDSPVNYWSGFLAFASLHMDELHCLFHKQMAEALVCSAEREYTAEHAAVLGAMWGMAEFVQLFAQELSIPSSKIMDSGWQDYVIGLLEESDAQYAAPDGLADSFLAAARQAIHQKGIPCYRIGQILPTIPHGAVYFNDDAVCFDRIIFEKICQAAGCQSGAVKRELAEQGYFTGKAVNSQSYQTRISLFGGDGNNRMIRVYKLRREILEVLGEPALFPEV